MFSRVLRAGDEMVQNRNMNTKRAGPAAEIIRQLGGVRATARLLDVHPSTVTRWVEGRGWIPARYGAAVLAAARERGLPITAETLLEPAK